MTWVTGAGGTEGAETVLTVALAPPATGTTLRLTHVGFPHEEARFANNEAWPHVLNTSTTGQRLAVHLKWL